VERTGVEQAPEWEWFAAGPPERPARPALVAGAAAALGAFLKGIEADDPAKRTRYRWSIDARADN